MTALEVALTLALLAFSIALALMLVPCDEELRT